MPGEPLITIGLPFRNGQPHLAQAIAPFQNQTRGDFRLIVCDNASTDETQRIALEIGARDTRIRYVRHATDLGPTGNFVFAADQARTPYFSWAAHDDLRDPEFLQKLVGLLENHPSAALACCGVRDIDP